MQTCIDKEKERSEEDEMKRGERCVVFMTTMLMSCVCLCLCESCWTVDWIGCNAFTKASCRFDGECRLNMNILVEKRRLRGRERERERERDEMRE
jgi:hypothetical protein